MTLRFEVGRDGRCARAQVSSRAECALDNRHLHLIEQFELLHAHGFDIFAQRLAAALDEVERGVPVVIERRGVRYVLSVEAPKARPARRQSLIETIDPAIADGQWTWTWTARGLRLKKPTRR